MDPGFVAHLQRNWPLTVLVVGIALYLAVCLAIGVFYTNQGLVYRAATPARYWRWVRLFGLLLLGCAAAPRRPVPPRLTSTPAPAESGRAGKNRDRHSIPARGPGRHVTVARRRKEAPMSLTSQKVTPMLWFDGQAEDAARLYVSVFEDAELGHISRQPDGSPLVVEFTLAGQRFTALNGGPQYAFSPAVSFVVDCATQEEVDHFWDKLSEGGDPEAQQCGWLKDRFGVSWQIVPRQLMEYMGDPDPEKSGRTVQAMLQMKKLDIAELKRAHDGAE